MAEQTTDQQQKPRKRRWGWGLLLIVLGLLALDYVTYPLHARPHGPAADRGENGLWIRYKWYTGEEPITGVSRLAQRLRDGGMAYAYCHVRHLEPNGTLHYRRPESAKKLTAALHALAPGVKVFAWIVVATEQFPGKSLPHTDLADPAVRANAVAEAKWLVQTCGFDGVQWDYEICANGDARLLALLDDTRKALPGVPVSVCTPLWTPKPITGFYGWDSAFFGEVAARCDQLTVMNYDTAMVSPRWYVALTREQVAQVTRAVQAKNPACRVLIGVPTYEQGGISHNPAAENLRMALIGVRDGLTDARTEHGPFAGVALFAEYTTSDDEWHTYRELWRTQR